MIKYDMERKTVRFANDNYSVKSRNKREGSRDTQSVAHVIIGFQDCGAIAIELKCPSRYKIHTSLTIYCHQARKLARLISRVLG